MFSQRCFQCVLNDFQENVFKTIIMRRFFDIEKTFWKHFKNMFSQRRFQNVMKDFQEKGFKTFIMRRFQDIQYYAKNVLKTSFIWFLMILKTF